MFKRRAISLIPFVSVAEMRIVCGSSRFDRAFDAADSSSMGSPFASNLNLIFLSRNRHLIKIFLSLFKDTFYAEERLQKIGLKEFVDLCVDLLDLLDFESKNIATRKLACL